MGNSIGMMKKQLLFSMRESDVPTVKGFLVFRKFLSIAGSFTPIIETFHFENLPSRTISLSGRRECGNSLFRPAFRFGPNEFV